jgi:predicted RNA-binding Zn ribbon-like protein
MLIKMDTEAVRGREVDVGGTRGTRGTRREGRFELRGGVACLDFLNTVGWRLTDHPSEYLRSYEDLLEGERETLSRALALREAIHRAVSLAIAGEPQDEDDVSVLNHELSIALSRLRVVPAGGAAGSAYGWGWDRSGDDGGTRLDSPLWPVAQSAADLLTSPKLGRVKVCAGEGCGWVFLDESRNASRVWCDSRDCGNRERVRRHLARKRASSS